MPDSHALLSPSSSSRWLQCPASVRLAEKLPTEPAGPYAEEGTQAHTVAEIKAARAFGLISEETFRARLDEWAAEVPPERHADQIHYAGLYAEHLLDLADRLPYCQPLLEKRVNPGVPSCWGTADAVLLSPDVIHVVDYKYGMGVRVEAEENTQMMLYGLGALETYETVIGDAHTVSMTIFQPRLNHVSTWSISADELRIWRDTRVLPIAEEALTDTARFGPSETACRFCPASGRCAAQTRQILEEDFGDPDLLDGNGYAAALARVPEIKVWLEGLEAAALHRIYSDREEIPGWKVVLSGGRRSIADPATAIQTLIDAGYTAEQVADIRTVPIGKLEKVVGKADLPEILGDLLVKSPGRPSLARESDKRQSIHDDPRLDFEE
jgi:hypothetical protein